MSIDWRGVAMALGQLREMAGPSELEKMKYEYDLREESKKEEREYQAGIRESDRIWQAHLLKDERKHEKDLIGEKRTYDKSVKHEDRKYAEGRVDDERAYQKRLLGDKRDYEGKLLDKKLAREDYLISDKREYDKNEKNEDRIFELNNAIIENYKNSITTAEGNIEQLDNKLLELSSNLAGLPVDEKSGGNGVQNILNMNDISAKEKQKLIVEDLTNKVGNVLKNESERVRLLNQGKHGKELYETAGKVGKLGSVSFDSNEDGFVSNEEYSKGLESYIQLLKDNNMDVDGIEEGFLAAMDSESVLHQKELGYHQDVISLERADIQLSADRAEANGLVSDNREEAFYQDIIDYYTLAQQHGSLSYDLDSRLKKDKKSEITAMAKKLGDLQVSISDKGGYDLLGALGNKDMQQKIMDGSQFNDKKEWVKGVQNVTRKDKNNETKSYPAGLITKDKYFNLLKGKHQFESPDPNNPISTAENMYMNLKLASEMSFVMENWKKGHRGRLSKELQAQWDMYYNDIKQYAN